MIVLITSEKKISRESELLNQMMSEHENLRLHIRKPLDQKSQIIELISAIDKKFYTRMSIHEFHENVALFEGISVHFKEKDRETESVIEFEHTRETGIETGTGKKTATAQHLEMKPKSTSFHELPSLEEALEYDYFFCSPIFESISKEGYGPKFYWNLNGLNPEIVKRSVALGGIQARNLLELKMQGFKSFALLGAVWTSENPVELLKKTIQEWESLDHTA